MFEIWAARHLDCTRWPDMSVVNKYFKLLIQKSIQRRLERLLKVESNDNRIFLTKDDICLSCCVSYPRIKQAKRHVWTIALVTSPNVFRVLFFVVVIYVHRFSGQFSISSATAKVWGILIKAKIVNVRYTHCPDSIELYIKFE